MIVRPDRHEFSAAEGDVRQTEMSPQAITCWQFDLLPRDPIDRPNDGGGRIISPAFLAQSHKNVRSKRDFGEIGLDRRIGRQPRVLMHRINIGRDQGEAAEKYK